MIQGRGGGESTVTVTTSRTTSHDDAKLVSKFDVVWERKSRKWISNIVTVFLVSNITIILVNLSWLSKNLGDFKLSFEIAVIDILS